MIILVGAAQSGGLPEAPDPLSERKVCTVERKAPCAVPAPQPNTPPMRPAASRLITTTLIAATAMRITPSAAASLDEPAM